MMTENNVTPPQARELLESDRNYVYLDVRTEAEFEAGRAPGAVNIPLARINEMGAMELNPDFVDVVRVHFSQHTQLIVGCKSGGRSARACQLLAEHGYRNAHNLLGGFIGVHGPGGHILEPGWSALGFPVETGDAGDRGYGALARKRDESDSKP